MTENSPSTDPTSPDFVPGFDMIDGGESVSRPPEDRIARAHTHPIGPSAAFI
jgi:hypothetical protein